MDTDLLCSDPAGALGSAQRTPFHVGASLHGSQHCSLVGQSPFQHLAWPGTGVGWHAPGPLFVSKWLSCSSCGSCFSPARECGGWPAFHGTAFVSFCPFAHLCCSAFLRPLFAVQREFLKLNKRYPDCRLHVPKAGGSSSMASYSRPQ